jgi:hypothetical protein
MGFSFVLSGFPLFVLIITALSSNFAVTGAAPVCVSQAGGSCAGNAGNPNLMPFTCTSGFNPCFPTGNIPANAAITCTTTDKPTAGSGLGQACLLINGSCAGGTTTLGSAATCVLGGFFQPTQLYLTNGFTVTTTAVTTAGGASVNNVQNTTFSVSNDWTIIGVGVLALAIVGSIAVFGSSAFNTETAHLVFVVTAMLAAWGILTLASGFGNVNSFWGQLDAASGFNMGSTGYAILSLVYFASIIKAISRGGT